MSIENITEEIEQEEKYVPKAVLFQQSSGGQKLKAEIEKSDAEEEEIKGRIRKTRGMAASAINTKLFNITSLLYPGNISSGAMMFGLFFVLGAVLHPNIFAEPIPYEEVNQLMAITVIALAVCFTARIITSFMIFIGMRTLRESAVRYETKISSEGATIMRVASWIRFVTTVIFAVSIVFSPELILSDLIMAAFYLITDIVIKISAGRVRGAIAEGEAKKLPVAAVILCFIHALLNIYAVFAIIGVGEIMFSIGIYAWILRLLMAVSAVSLILLGIFVIYYNAKVGKHLKENN